ncbi:MAG: alkaline shock response membrane anchor protein AmaP [Chloroflexi bacterium]|nr:alkaline shock response membrane anchor protein AmaP [Chloroflexota bacterium]
MNVINRVVVILLLVAISVTTILLAVIPEQIVLAIRETFNPMEINLLDRVVLAGAAIVVCVLSILLVRAEIRREKPRGVVLASVEGASAQLSTDSIAERIKRGLEDLPGIHGASLRVKSRGKTVEISVTLQADPGVDPQQKATEAAGVIHDIVEKGMGVGIAKGSPKVDIKYHNSIAPRLDFKR